MSIVRELCCSDLFLPFPYAAMRDGRVEDLAGVHKPVRIECLLDALHYAESVWPYFLKQFFFFEEAD